jgi:hypothetical protein
VIDRAGLAEEKAETCREAKYGKLFCSKSH